MPRYLDVAAQANETAKRLMRMTDEKDWPAVAEMIARLVNYGIRCNPRPAQSTVRLNAVKRAVQDMPVRVEMVTKEGDRGTYNAPPDYAARRLPHDGRLGLGRLTAVPPPPPTETAGQARPSLNPFLY